MENLTDLTDYDFYRTIQHIYVIDYHNPELLDVNLKIFLANHADYLNYIKLEYISVIKIENFLYMNVIHDGIPKHIPFREFEIIFPDGSLAAYKRMKTINNIIKE